MISRRLLRVKALQLLYAYRTTQENNLKNSEKELLFSIEKSYDLYHLLMLLLIDLSDYSQNRLEIAQTKYFPTNEEANPNRRFIDNRVIQKLRHHESYWNHIQQRGLNWVNHAELIKHYYREMVDSDIYTSYLEQPEDNFNKDKSFVIQLFSEIIVPDELLHQTLEEMSIYWNDDLDFLSAMTVKTLERWKEDVPAYMLKMFKNDDDRKYIIDLFRKVVVHSEEYEQLIKQYSENWDFDRLAFMDILIMQLAIAEVIHFPSIPVKVTLNEYIEISKYYSTEKSSLFINGILDKVFGQLKGDKIIRKSGRGLMGETQ